MGDQLLEVRLEEFVPPHFDRETRDSAFLDRLGQSLLENGFLHPVRCFKEVVENLERYRVLTGWSRVLAARRVGLSTAPALILHRELTEAERLVEQIIENQLRDDPNPLDKARFLIRLMEVTNWTQAEVARALHLSPAEVSKSIAIFARLPEDLQAKVGTGEGKLPLSVAYLLTRLPDPVTMRELAEKVLNGLLKRDAVEARVASLLNGRKRLKVKPLKLSLAAGVVVILPAVSFDALLDALTMVAGAIKKAQKLDLPMAALPGLVRG